MKKDSTNEKAIKQMVGKVFDKLTVIEYAGRDLRKWGYVHFWRCQCECGNLIDVRGTTLRNGTTRSCGCLIRKKQEESAKNRYLWTYKDAAKRKHRDFTLTKEEFCELIFQECHYCGRHPKRIFPTGSVRCINGRILVNGIDRIDNTIGYVKENCVPCCEICNLAKRKMSYEDFTTWLDDIVMFRSNNKG